MLDTEVGFVTSEIANLCRDIAVRKEGGCVLGGQFAVTIRRTSEVNRPQREADENRNIEPTNILFLSLCIQVVLRHSDASCVQLPPRLFCDVLLTVQHLSIILVINQLDAQHLVL